MRDIKLHSAGEWPARPAFETMPDFLKDVAEWHRFAPGEHLFKLGEQPKLMFYIAEGEVRLRRYSPDGSEIILQRAKLNFLAEASMESLTYHCDTVAIDPIRAISFPLLVFRKTIEECPAFRTQWISHLMREVRRSRAQCERLTLKTASARVMHFIESEGRDGRLELTHSRKTWAAELGLSHEALYRTLAQLQRTGKIVLEGNTVVRLP
ncbi:MAG: Crp/Fnr family transcriptional regulator [Dechloromonas sp.]|uniref:Crp/Fnr family transcriptional regulator n=1 Tax=Dechloromonas sp. TaxID=1917218 RepID=UPI0027E9D139|nr:Crp/Fnr family transcriptional regulator [Dechloromonas sp.]MBT9522574.1 Crp/Fnr family transcriptional regulator [Dechloromonas sp.]